jgi:hypothetical protein
MSNQTADYNGRKITGHDAEVNERLQWEMRGLLYSCERAECKRGEQCRECLPIIDCPDYTTDLNALRPVLEEIEKRGRSYVTNFVGIVWQMAGGGKDDEYTTWQVLKFPVHIIAVAALLTLEGE